MAASKLNQHKIVQVVGSLLKQGMSPEKISESISWGVILGIVPLPGTTTILCTIAALALRLNLPAVQLMNWLVYPLQIALIIPFFILGTVLFGTDPLTVDAREIVTLLQTDLTGSFEMLGTIILHGIIAWLLIAPVLLLACTHLVLILVRRIPLRSKH
ncbi:MAG: DUF2062 domain-containing protein [Desulfomonilia bacterium]|nr:DUF2062 domain-containing protein [Desulfomonilia bacterium]